MLMLIQMYFTTVAGKYNQGVNQQSGCIFLPDGQAGILGSFLVTFWTSKK
jgi:hypothetical protein